MTVYPFGGSAYHQHRAAMFHQWSVDCLAKGNKVCAVRFQHEAATHARLARLTLTGLIHGLATYREVSAKMRELSNHG